jgi:hypothetical protein
MESNFDIYLTGQILPGYQRGDAVAKLADLFGLDVGMADQLLNGTRRRVKKSCNKASALHFRKILTDAGLQVTVQRQTSTRGPIEAGTAALEKSPHEKAIFEAKTPTIPSELIQIQSQADADKPVDYEPIDRVSSRPSAKPYVVDVQVPLEVAPAGELLLSPTPAQTPSAFGQGFDLAPAGAVIPTIKRASKPINPNTDHLNLAPSKEH